MKTQETQTNVAGRPAGSRLDDVGVQDVLIKNIAKNGDVFGCHAGICSRRTFELWKKRNRARWEKIRRAGMDEFALQIQISAPSLLEKAIARLQAKLDADKLSPHDLLETIKYFDARRQKA